MRVYVASAYDTALRYGKDRKFVRDLAIQALEKANHHFDDSDELFSPVLSFMNKHKDKSREIVMHLCFSELSECDVLFIPNLRYTILSDGIKDEFEFAIKSGIKVVFESISTLETFYRRRDQYDQEQSESNSEPVSLKEMIEIQNENIKFALEKIGFLFSKLEDICKKIKA